MKQLTPSQFLESIANLNNKLDVEMFRARTEIGQHSVDHFKSSFEQKGFADGRNQKWPDRTRNYPWSIMNKTGNLKNSIKATLISSSNRITISTDVPYAQYHNDPSSIGWRRNQFTDLPIQRRQFIGNSQSLERWIERRIKKALTNTFR